MTELTAYRCPELMILVPVLYVLGVILKKSPLQDWLIPYVLCGVGCALSFAYLAGQGASAPEDWMTLLFSAVTQGVLCTACSVYVKNLIKQGKEGRRE
jgi:hypothetical protein